jgi:hypothetical protein
VADYKPVKPSLDLARRYSQFAGHRRLLWPRCPALASYIVDKQVQTHGSVVLIVIPQYP